MGEDLGFLVAVTEVAEQAQGAYFALVEAVSLLRHAVDSSYARHPVCAGRVHEDLKLI